MANIISSKEVCNSWSIGKVVWLESYFYGFPSLCPFMYDIDSTQKPVLVNTSYQLSIYGSELDDQIMDLFNERWKDKRYRWWDSYPTVKERNNTPW